jgi:hypothetical protein
MIKGSAEHETYRQSILKQAEDEATAKFAALLPNLTSNIDAALAALVDLQAVRGLTPCEQSIMAGLIKLDLLKTALSSFNKEALNKV